MADSDLHDWLDQHPDAAADDPAAPPGAAALLRLRECARRQATAHTDRTGRVRLQAALDRALAEPVQAPPVGEILTPEELAAYLRVPLDTIDASELPGFVIGAHLRFRKSRIDQWIAEQERLYATYRARESVRVG